MKASHRFRMWRSILRKRKVNRSKAGSFVMFTFLIICATFTALPLIYTVVTAFKPLDELWLFPPSLVTVNNPTVKNFIDMFVLMADSTVPFSRYIFNTVFITFAGMLLHVIFATMCAYPLAKKQFPGKNLFFGLVTLALMFNTYVTSMPNYLTMANLGWVDTYLAVIIPAIGAPIGLYLMRQFMEQIPDAVLEAARVDGANEWQTFWRVVIPQVKPAWLTIMIFSFNGLWNLQQSNYIYSEELKTLPFALGQIANGGIARAGVSAAVTMLLLSVPVLFFVATQSNIIETMNSSGIKE